jgi:hypothetical protein
MATKTPTPALDAGIVKRGAAAPAQSTEAEGQAPQGAQPEQRGPSPVMTAMLRLMPTPPSEAPAKPAERRANKRATPKDLGYHMQSVKLTEDEYKRVRWAGFALGKSYQEIYTEALTDWLLKHKDIFGSGFASQE